MAGHFPLALRQDLMRGFDMSRVSRTAVLSHVGGVASDVDIASRVNDWGSTTLRLMNDDPRNRGGLYYPELTITCKNDDEFFTPGTFPGAWQGYEPQQWIYTFDAKYEVDGTLYSLVPLSEWSVVNVYLPGQVAEITMIHRLSRFWSHRFGSADEYTDTAPGTWG